VGQGRYEGRLAATIAPQRLSGIASSVGGGEDIFLDRPQQEDELRDYERFLCASGEALVYAAMIRLMTRRLTPCEDFSYSLGKRILGSPHSPGPTPMSVANSDRLPSSIIPTTS